MVIGFIGVGNLASAVIGGLRRSEKYAKTALCLYDRFSEKTAAFSDSHTEICSSETEVVGKSDYIFVAIKPADFETALAAINKSDLTGKVFISTAAGVTTGYISSRLSGAKVVRSMPNTPISVGMGATAICGSANVTADELETVRSIFSACGECRLLDESLMNKVIAVNGSSPAYVFAFIKAMADWGQSVGIDFQTALQLAAQAVKGSAQMLSQSSKTPEQLIKDVCSPGGTTIEAMKVFEEGGLEKLVFSAMDACTRRADEMEKR